MEITNAHLAADLVLFAVDKHDQEHVLLIRRSWPPFVGCWALPGGYVNTDEETDDAARRELKEETGLVAPADLITVGAYAAVGRDPRARVVSFVYTAALPMLFKPVPGDDAKDARWFPLTALPPLAFDHATILDAAVQAWN